jgi:hypothetical protein
MGEMGLLTNADFGREPDVISGRPLFSQNPSIGHVRQIPTVVSHPRHQFLSHTGGNRIDGERIICPPAPSVAQTPHGTIRWWRLARRVIQ